MSAPIKQLVLCVDDEAALCDILAEELRYLGYESISVHSGSEALALIQSQTFAAVVSDIKMPNGDGIFLLRGIQSMSLPRPPVVLITGHTEVLPEEVYAGGAQALLAKPIDYDLLAKHLQTILRAPAERFAGVDPRPAAATTITLSLPSLADCDKAGKFCLGFGGFFVAMTTGWPALGKRADFSLSFSGSDLPSLKGSGTCRWIRASVRGTWRAGVGIEIESLRPDSLEAFMRLQDELGGRGFIPLG